MKKEYTVRTEKLIGSDGVAALATKSVLVFGLGGVGSFTVEALVRAGIGKLTLVDKDVFDESNINRQLGALPSTVGRAKAEVMAERVRSVNPDIYVDAQVRFYLPEEDTDFIKDVNPDYIVDAVDNMTAKIAIAEKAHELGIPLISSMGAGNKLHPELFELDYIENTSVDPLAKIMRKKMKERGIRRLKVVYSKEIPVTHKIPEDSARVSPGSISFVPSVAGLIMAGAVVRDLLGIKKNKGYL
mgnify:FL=1